MSIRVYVGIGSNLDREIRIREAVTALRARFEPIEISPVPPATLSDETSDQVRADSPLD